MKSTLTPFRIKKRTLRQAGMDSELVLAALTEMGVAASD